MFEALGYAWVMMICKSRRRRRRESEAIKEIAPRVPLLAKARLRLCARHSQTDRGCLCAASVADADATAATAFVVLLLLLLLLLLLMNVLYENMTTMWLEKCSAYQHTGVRVCVWVNLRFSYSIWLSLKYELKCIKRRASACATVTQLCKAVEIRVNYQSCTAYFELDIEVHILRCSNCKQSSVQVTRLELITRVALLTLSWIQNCN